jgi:hypothetical protein
MRLACSQLGWMPLGPIASDASVMTMSEITRQYQVALEHRRRFEQFSDDWFQADEHVRELEILMFNAWMTHE